MDSGIDTSTSPSLQGSGSYNRLLNPSEIEESKGQLINGRQTKSTTDTAQCNHTNSTTGQMDATPSTAEEGQLPVRFPRDADVLQSAVASALCCCPVCGCMAIASAKKARRLRNAGKYCAAAEASHLSTRWAVRAVYWGCFIFLGLMISVIIFLVTRYMY